MAKAQSTTEHAKKPADVIGGLVDLQNDCDTRLIRLNALTIMMQNDHDGNTLENNTPAEYRFTLTCWLGDELIELKNDITERLRDLRAAVTGIADD